MKVVLPPPRFAVIIPSRVTDDDGGEAVVEYDWMRNHRLYEHEGTAISYAKSIGRTWPFYRASDGKRTSPPAIVLRCDPEVIEPGGLGLTPQQEYEFCERMTEHWAKRTMIARQRAEGTEPAAPRPKKRTPKKKKATQKTNQAKVSKLAKQVLMMASASALGAILANAWSNASASAPPPTPPDPGPPTAYNPLLLEQTKGTDDE